MILKLRNVIIRNLFPFLAVLIIPFNNANAQVTGQIDVLMTLVDGCAVENSSASSGVDFGELDFGSVSTLFSQADAQVVGVNGNGITVQCSSGLTPTIEIVEGSNDLSSGSTVHALTDGTDFIDYDIFDDPSYGAGNLLSNGETISITADGTEQTINLYGRAYGGSGLSAGAFTDTLTMQVSF